MGTILDKIIAQKHRELGEIKHALEEKRGQDNYFKRSFLEKLKPADELKIIAEFKRASPSKGDINIGADPQAQARAYVEFGADAISVLTDKSFFKGSFADLEAVRAAVDSPILCKDFMIDRSQIELAKRSGANIILLIAAALEKEQLKELYNFSIANGLEVLIEVHNARELETALETGTKLIGVNNRDLKTFKVDLGVTETLAPQIKKSGAFLISESGLKTKADVERAVRAGANGILVGEALMAAGSLEEQLKGMKVPVMKAEQR
ncbi:indole-3-glycerol phosphate synthase TrpC [Bacillus sp. V3-13]|uniref:indole-3-glycerol phosphate synthase TrpC n=1 Tax=Bacillus sp. V3-13 TaxID=2053728 RepID=UPI000C77A318|nr:indole-3-glycerol phosphate synthase TrpC [Bacillus sp. V3-13]PLR78427.1 indole-3-glycerol phosphate synthase TrpC [Bacillus sp. V3-13]